MKKIEESGNAALIAFTIDVGSPKLLLSDPKADPANNSKYTLANW